MWLLLFRSRLGYAIRVVGQNQIAATYAGINTQKIIIIAMAISGGLAGLMALNEVFGAQNRLILNFTGGFGFIGIAVALMGRNHPVGVILASLLFGAFIRRNRASVRNAKSKSGTDYGDPGIGDFLHRCNGSFDQGAG